MPTSREARWTQKDTEIMERYLKLKAEGKIKGIVLVPRDVD
jgi:hypothetical protein